MSDWNFVAAAYGLTWVVLAAYTLYLRGRRRRAEALYDRAAAETTSGAAGKGEA